MRASKLKHELTGWGFVALASVLIVIFFFYPMANALWLSFHSGLGVNLNFVGLANYQRLFQDATFLAAVRNTFIYLIIQVPLMIVLALFFSTLLNQKGLRFRGFFRTAIFLPAITSLVAYSTVFSMLFGYQGLINSVLMDWGIIQSNVAWLSDPFFARATIIMAITWRWTGYNMIFYLSALQNVDPAIYEAAKIDGASGIQQFFKITIPMLKPIILFTSIMSTNGTLQLFDEVVNITGGGPGHSTLTISQYVYNLSFVFTPDFGYAATVSYAILILVTLLAFIQFKFVGGDNQ